LAGLTQRSMQQGHLPFTFLRRDDFIFTVIYNPTSHPRPPPSPCSRDKVPTGRRCILVSSCLNPPPLLPPARRTLRHTHLTRVRLPAQLSGRDTALAHRALDLTVLDLSVDKGGDGRDFHFVPAPFRFFRFTCHFSTNGSTSRPCASM
jgi:hypothetical protein